MGKKKKLTEKMAFKGTEKNQIPDEMTLRLTDSGIHIGMVSRQGYYTGIPETAEGNLLAVGGVGSGKSIGIAAPTLLTWGGTAFVIDVKGELSDAYRRMLRSGLVKRPCSVIDPSDPDACAYDPFSFLTRDGDDNLMSDLNDLIRAIIPDEPEVPDPFWTTAAQQIVAAMMLRYYRMGLSFSEAVAKIMASTTSGLCRDLAECEDAEVRSLVGEVDGNLKLATSIDRTIRNRLSLFAVDPCIAHLFRGEREGAQCLKWESLADTVIFLKVPSYKIESWAPAINLMVTQLLRSLERRPEKRSEEGKTQKPVLLLLDELPRLGKLPMLATCLATYRSKGVFTVLIVQSLAQLDKLYGENERREIVDNCNYIAILRANDAETQKYLSELVGTRLRKEHSLTQQMDKHLKKTGYSWQTSETRESTVQPHEFATLKDIVLLSPDGICRVDKLPAGSNLADAKKAALRAIGEWVTPSAPPERAHSTGTTRLSIEERLHNADERIAAFEAKAREERREARRREIVDQLMNELYPDTTETDRSHRLNDCLADLAEDPEAVRWLREWVQHGSRSPGLLISPTSHQ